MSKVKGILIDSGRVLNVPFTGDWYYSPKFFQIIDKDNFESIPKNRREAAFSKGKAYINSIRFINTIEEELNHFQNFFTILAEELPELKIDEEIKKLLTDDFVINFDKYVFFKDVFEVLPRLSKTLKLALVSDAWPSLRGVYKKANLDTYFDSIIISSELGITKPSEQMYLAALQELNLDRDAVVFIDDNPKNCDGAAKLGIKAIILDRSRISRFHSRFILRTQHKIVKNLYEVENLV